ncbi:MAG: hypothetical protein WC784_01870 [Candidatus Shapirobacteria bacterium]|jgi:hypothetical protein
MDTKEKLKSNKVKGTTFIEKLKLFTMGLIAGWVLTVICEYSKLQSSLLYS